MLSKITQKWLSEKSACSEGVEWFLRREETHTIKIIQALVAEDKWSWANWTIVRVMNYKQKVQYAVFAAEQVINIYEKKYPNNDKPRKAIEAAKKCIDSPSKENRSDAAAYAADAAADTDAAANAAADAANAAAYATNAAADAAAYAANAAADAANSDVAARNILRLKIINYGIGLLEESDVK